jgi:hypothetical protein
MWSSFERGPASVGTLLILLSRRATAAESPYQCAMLVNRHGPLGRQHAPPQGGDDGLDHGRVRRQRATGPFNTSCGRCLPLGNRRAHGISPFHMVQSQEMPPSVAHGYAYLDRKFFRLG